MKKEKRDSLSVHFKKLLEGIEEWTEKYNLKEDDPQSAKEMLIQFSVMMKVMYGKNAWIALSSLLHIEAQRELDQNPGIGSKVYESEEKPDYLG